jgi:glycine/sarcosine N-methyltransferase
MTDQFYDLLADYYHLIYEDWEQAMRRQGQILSAHLPPLRPSCRILDAACGIGTQALPLAALGYHIDGSDRSVAALARAAREAENRGLPCRFRRDDIRTLQFAPIGAYHAIIAMDNVLPHLDSDDEIIQALAAVRARLMPGGIAMFSVRDYEALLAARPTAQAPAFYTNKPRRIYHQVWEWIDERRYVVHLYLTLLGARGWQSLHFVGQYRAVTIRELMTLAGKVGFVRIRHVSGETTGYQPIIRCENPE